MRVLWKFKKRDEGIMVFFQKLRKRDEGIMVFFKKTGNRTFRKQNVMEGTGSSIHFWSPPPPPPIARTPPPSPSKMNFYVS